jgi:putative spermidine/putrescine transport system ATP-binding protein
VADRAPRECERGTGALPALIGVHGAVRDGRLSWAGVELPAPGPDGPATLAIRPDHVELAQDGPLRATVTEAVYTGAHVRLVALRGDHRLEAHVAPAQAPRAGDEVALELPAQRLWRLPGDGGDAGASDELRQASGAPSPHADPR